MRSRASLYVGPMLALIVPLTACTTPAPQVIRVQVPVPCVVELPPVPAITTGGELLAMNDYRLLITIARERLVLLSYAEELRASAQGCLPTSP